MSEERKDHRRKGLEECGFFASEAGTCENWWFGWLTIDTHTARARFSNTHQARFPNRKRYLPVGAMLYYNLLYRGVESMISCGRSGLQSHSLYKNQIWYATGKYLFCATPSERTSFSTESNVPQGKPQTLSDRQWMPYDKQSSRHTPRFPPLPTVFDLLGEG